MMAGFSRMVVVRRLFRGAAPRLSTSAVRALGERLGSALLELGPWPGAGEPATRRRAPGPRPLAVRAAGPAFDLDAHAAASLQARLANCTPEQRAELVSSLMPLVDGMCGSERGPYVLQAMLSAAAATPFLMQELGARLAPRCVQLALHPYGFYVARKLLFQLDPEWQLTTQIAHGRLLPAAAQLALSPSGVRVLSYAQMRGLFAGPAAQRQLVAALAPHVLAVSTEKHGARLVRRLLAEPGAAAEARTPLVSALLAHAPELAADEYGAAVVRALLEPPAGCAEASQLQLVRALQPHALRLATHALGHSALQACLLASAPDHAAASGAVRAERRQLASLLLAHAHALATDPFGSCVLQAALLYDVPARPAVLTRLIDRSDELARDRSGNHVLQHALARAEGAERRRACELLAASCVELAAHKHGSFALQGALRTCSREQRAPLSAALCAAAPELATERISSMVLQQLLRAAPADEAAALIDAHLLPRVGELMRNDHAVFVLHECAQLSPAVGLAMRAELGRVERAIDEFADSGRGVLALPLELSAFQRKRAHLYVRRRFGAALVSMSIGESDEARALHVFKSEGVRAQPRRLAEGEDEGDDDIEPFLGPREDAEHSEDDAASDEHGRQHSAGSGSEFCNRALRELLLHPNVA